VAFLACTCQSLPGSLVGFGTDGESVEGQAHTCAAASLRGGVLLSSSLLCSLSWLSQLDPDPLPEIPSLGRQSRCHTPPLPPLGLFRDAEL
jgi:hypothetical protein